MSGGATTDAADEAGGEAIFSSDGLPPLSPPVAPVSSASTESLSPLEAFEVFSGRLFPPSSAVQQKLDDEPPLVRLARLQTELKALEKDLQSAPSSEHFAAEDVTQVMQGLSSRLDSLSTNAASTLFKGRQSDLTTLVQSSQYKSTGSAASALTKNEGVVYELYGGPASAASAVDVSLQERLQAMEALVGSDASGKSILQRLEQAELMASKADPRSLEAAANRAKVIRADLEAAAKARSKMTTSALSLSGDDAKTIAALHQFLMDMDGCDSHLAAVVARLEQLAELHGQASHFATRLASAETVVAETASMLAGVEDVLQRVETGFAENQTILQQNVANLDERIQKLS